MTEHENSLVLTGTERGLLRVKKLEEVWKINEVYSQRTRRKEG